MSRDRREEIFARLVTIAEAIEGVNYVSRNELSIDDVALPAIILIDGDETPALDPRGQAPRGPRLMKANAEAHILIDGDAETLGSELNAMRQKLRKAVLEDADLLAIVGSNGRIDFTGSGVVFNQGTKLQGELAVGFAFIFPLLEAEL